VSFKHIGLGHMNENAVTNRGTEREEEAPPVFHPAMKCLWVCWWRESWGLSPSEQGEPHPSSSSSFLPIFLPLLPLSLPGSEICSRMGGCRVQGEYEGV